MSQDKSRCLRCIYFGLSTKTCDYILLEGHRRPCPPGDGCTVRRTRKDLNVRKPKWDTELGRLLWLEGKSDGEIADELHIPTSSVTSYRRRHWEKQLVRKEDAPPGLPDGAAEEADEESEDDVGAADSGVTVIEHVTTVIEYHENDTRSEETVMDEAINNTAAAASKDKKHLEVYDVLEAATAEMKGIQAICTADAIMCLWNWKNKEDLLKARSSIDYLLRRLGG